jgi:NMD protein affecting ribosome stability and mRNA decay
MTFGQKRKGNVTRKPASPSRADKLYNFGRKDPFEAKQKLSEPTRCPSCEALFVDGRWTWETPEPDADVVEELCPACQRAKQGMPAGQVELKGDFLAEHYNEIRNLVQNEAKAEKVDHPLERIMAADAQNGRLYIETTGIHLARRIGDAVHNAYEGELNVTYLDSEHRIQVEWERQS